jgi:enoyl-CoA hydratase/carnithine racemase
MDDGAIQVERRGGVAWCVLARPPLNLVDRPLMDQLREVFQTLPGEPWVRAAVLTARGRAFSAGLDVRLLGGLDAAGARALISALHRALDAVHRAPIPVVAAVDGPCLGAGFELALACDLRVATTAATFGLPEVRVGIPSVIEAALLPSVVGWGRAAELLLTGEPISAQQALTWGLVTQVVEPGRLTAATEDLVGRILAGGPRALRLQKELLVRWRHTDLATAIRDGIDAFARAFETQEPQEGAAAFLDKRRAVFEEGL